jgi:hypothetical protein
MGFKDVSKCLALYSLDIPRGRNEFKVNIDSENTSDNKSDDLK